MNIKDSQLSYMNNQRRVLWADWAVFERILIIFYNRITMEFISTIINFSKSVTETDRQFRILRQKLVFHIKKGQTALNVFKKSNRKLTFIGQNLEGRLRDAHQRLAELQTLLTSSSNEDKQSISFKDKLKLSLPFNNEKDKITHTIEDLRQATQEVLNNQLPHSDNKRKIEGPPPEPDLDQQIDQLYEMGPTIQENNALDVAMQFAKNQTIEVKVIPMGSEQILNLLSPENKEILVEKTLERVSKEEFIEIFQLGRMNFKKQYKALNGVFPDIGKISRLGHFKILWKRHVVNPMNDSNKRFDNAMTNDVSLKQSEMKVEGHSQKKEEGEQFFSVPDNMPEEMSNGSLILEKEKRILYRRLGAKWQKIEEESFELINGEEVAISLNKDNEAELYFKISYRFK